MKTSMKTVSEMTKYLVAVTYKRNDEKPWEVTYTAHYVGGCYEVLRKSESAIIEPYGYAIIHSQAERNLCNGAKANVTFTRKSAKNSSDKRDNEIARVEIVEETNENLAAIYLAGIKKNDPNLTDKNMKVYQILANRIANGTKKMYQ